ncbi:hypothetical protein LTR17_001097 [Elasticomyces elasticus]|nr:hypothetical protein LTR17_001097 [Elasticomyces elasticus]
MSMTDMSMAASATMTMSDMASMTMSDMASATADSMSGMDHSSMMMGMQDMMMVFFSAKNTPLYSTAWTPGTTGQYVGTCIFLIVLACIFRGLIALRCNFVALWTRSQRRRRGGLRYAADDPLVKQTRRPWAINEAASRAFLDTVLAGVSYLLMLAVMTMNVGYFLSILGGTFLGSFVIGGWTGTAAH